jgi:hypothetical protein
MALIVPSSFFRIDAGIHAPNFTERYIFWKFAYITIKLAWALFLFCISLNFARAILTVFEEIKHVRSRAPEKCFTRLLK